MKAPGAAQYLVDLARQKAVLLRRDAVAYQVRGFLVDSMNCRAEADRIEEAIAAFVGSYLSRED